jgi:ligand-binding sensor domain-containing protein
MAFYSDELWVLAGGVTPSWQPTFNSHAYYRFRNEEWFNKGPEIDANGIYDAVSISGNASSGDVWIGTQGAGVIHYKNGTLLDHFTDANSPLERSTGGFLFTPGVALDDNGNAWVANYDAPQQILKVRTPDNKWNAFNLGYNVTRAGEILIDDADNKWVVCPNQNDAGIIVMKDVDGPLGDRILTRKLTTGAKAGGLPSNVVRTIELDDAGEIWVGTDDGLAIIYNPTQIFEGGEDVDAKRKPIDDGKDVGYLLGSEVINDIKIDGANRKWIATNTGAWLVAEDGGSVIRHFTESNSPLLSNTVNCIGIDPRSGEVFFGTDLGIISYRSDASEGGNVHGDVVVYPNPIKENYFGPLTVTGLPKDATVKITDIAGRMVFETIANGGTLVWDVKNFQGQRPSTGVYLIFTANEEDKDALVSKVLILN